MNRKFIALTLLLSLGSFATFAGVKVTSVDLRLDGNNGFLNVSLDGRSQELPDVKVTGEMIEVSIAGAEAAQGISKNVRGALLTANTLNGKAIVKAVLPYAIAADAINVGWKNKNIEIIFPRGKSAQVLTKQANVVARSETDRPLVEIEDKKLEAIDKKIETNKEIKVSKTQLNEDYLNKLMQENVAPKQADTPKVPVVIKKDEVKVKQSSIALPVETAETKKVTGDFSFAGYALKFTVFLAMVLGLFYGVVQLLKKGLFNRGKLGFLNNSQMIQVLSTTYVAPKRSLMIVKAHKQIFLVANSESGIEFLSEMTDTSGLIKEGEKIVTGANFDTSLGVAETMSEAPSFKIKENINESTPIPEEKGIAALSAKEIVKFSDELKKKAKKLKPIEFN